MGVFSLFCFYYNISTRKVQGRTYTIPEKLILSVFLRLYLLLGHYGLRTVFFDRLKIPVESCHNF